MNLQLTDHLRHAIEEAAGSPVYIADPATKTSYVLLRAEDYEKLRPPGDPDDVSSMYPLLADIEPEDWENIIHFEKSS